MKHQSGLKNEVKVSELIQSGSLAIKTKNEYGVHVFSGSVDDDGILFGKLTKPRYNEEELKKSIDTVIVELIPIQAPVLPETVLKSIYDLALIEIDDLRLEVAQLNDEILVLNNKITEVEIVSESRRIQLDSKDLLVASIENENVFLNETWIIVMAKGHTICLHKQMKTLLCKCLKHGVNLYIQKN